MGRRSSKAGGNVLLFTDPWNSKCCRTRNCVGIKEAVIGALAFWVFQTKRLLDRAKEACQLSAELEVTEDEGAQAYFQKDLLWRVLR